MKKTAVLLLLALFLFNIGGYYFWFRISRQLNYRQIRKEIRSGLTEDDLDSVMVPSRESAGMIWTKPGKEFSLNGEMFDVVRVKGVKEGTVFFCIKDKKEKAIIARFGRRAR